MDSNGNTAGMRPPPQETASDDLGRLSQRRAPTHEGVTLRAVTAGGKERGPGRRTDGARSFTDLLVGVACLAILERLVELTYRRNGHLGPTMPDWQEAIVKGTAPAPFVYRQGVPQLRQLLMTVLQPGHAAFLVDLVLVVIALIAGTYLGSFVFGPHLRRLGTVVTCAALAGAFPNDKPESAAMVALVLVSLTAMLYDRHWLAATAATLASVARPDVAILFGAIASAAALVLRRRGGASRWRRMVGYVYLIPLVAGSLYLAMARFVWWPAAPYVVEPFMLTWNVLHFWSNPGVLIVLLLLLCGIGWIRDGLRRADEDGDAAARLLVVGGFISAWALAISTMGILGEVRLMTPVLPFCILMSLRPESWDRSPEVPQTATPPG